MGRKLGKNKKRSWKQVDIADVEDKLEQDRLDERIGRKTGEFAICTVGDKHVESAESSSDRKRVKLADPSEIAASIYCYKALENASKVPPAMRPLVSTAKPKEKEPYIFTNTSNSKKSMKCPQFFDLWEGDNQPKSEIDYLLPKSVKVPSNLFQKPLLLPSVSMPEAGQSYNPEMKAYSKLVRKVVKKEIKVATKAKKIARQASTVRRTQSELDKDYMNEMTQGLDLTPEDNANDAVDDKREEEEGEEATVITPVLKKKESKKKKKKKTVVRVVPKKEQPKSIKKILKEIKEEEALAQLKRKKRDAKIVSELHRPKKVRGIREEDKMIVPLPNEITGSLRSTRVIGSLLKERFTSIQERGLVDCAKREARGKNREKPWVKYSLKRSYRDDQ